VRALGWANCEC